MLHKIKDKGLKWFWQRILREYRNPSYSSVSKIVNSLLAIKRRIRSLVRSVKTDDQILYGIYDLEICDITYNFGIFLIALELESLMRKKKGFVVIIVPAMNDEGSLLRWNEYNEKIDLDSREWRFNNIIMQLMPLSRKCLGYYKMPDRQKITEFIQGHDVYPDLYDGVNLRKVDLTEVLFGKLNRNDLVDGLQSSNQGRKYINQWIRENSLEGEIITITIRNSAFDIGRNSNTEEWIKFATYLKSNGYCPVFIPDTDDAFSGIHFSSDYIFLRECCWNMGLRVALYERAHLNFFGNNGCVVLAMFNRNINYILMNGLPENSLVVNKDVLKEVGMLNIDRYKFSTTKQKLCFKSDSFENIKEEFLKFETVL